MNTVPRPGPPRSLAQRWREWVSWFGAGRLAATALGVVAVIAGGYWLVRPPAPRVEDRLPRAGAASPSPPTTTAPPPTSAQPAALLVHVAGGVVTPGVYQLHTGDRVIDAISAAGGLASDGNGDGVNLAAPVADGQRVYVPRVGEAVPVAAVAGTSSAAPDGPVNINAADATQLDTLPGIGPATAAAIVAYREQHGPFRSVDDLGEVRGIGPAKLDAIRGLVTV